MIQKKINLYLILCLGFILISNNLLSFLSFSVKAQSSELHTNNSTDNYSKAQGNGGNDTAAAADAADIGTTTLMNLDNQTQQSSQPRMNSCLNMMNPGMMTFYAYGSIIGSIKSGPVLNHSLSQIKISLSQAATAAEKEIGNNSHAIEAYLCDANGYLVYMIWLRGLHTDITDAIVDPANGKILLKNSNLFPPLQQNMSSDSMIMSNMPGMNH
jgi:uncharacterized membrane protein YkoI